MRNDKLIFKALVNRKDDINFQEKLIKHRLKEVYDSTINFYIANNSIKVPYIIFGSVYENINTKNIIKGQNISIFQNYVTFFIALSFFTYFGINYSALSHPSIGMLICFGMFIFTTKNILKAQEIKSAYSDMLSAIIINILDYVAYSDKSELSDKDVLHLLSDIKISKAALVKARDCGYLVKESDISVIYAKQADIKRDLAQLDDDFTPQKHIKIAK